MPPPVVRTLWELVYWEYAKLIAERGVGSRKNYGFFMDRFRELCAGRIQPSTILRENKLLVAEEKQCAYCGARGDFAWDHVIPRARGGPETIDNHVLACPSCNTEKHARDPFEWYRGKFGEQGKYRVPRLVAGKCLKLYFDAAAQRGLLDRALVDLAIEDIEDVGRLLHGLHG